MNKNNKARRDAESHWMWELLTKTTFKKGSHQNRKDKRTRTRKDKLNKAIKDFE